MTSISLRVVRNLSIVALLVGFFLMTALAVPQAGEGGSSDDSMKPQSQSGILDYRRGNFRDPFRSLNRQVENRGPRPPGPAGMLIEEIDLVGILSGPKGAMILIIGSDGLGYSLQEGSPLYDGKVLNIERTEGLVVFRQDVNDPNRIKPYRDIERRIESAS